MLSIATELDDYLRLRAAVEGVQYDVDAPWLARQMERVRVTTGSPPISVFGVHIEDDQLIGDDQEPSPGFFEAWKRSKTVPGSTPPRVRIEWAVRPESHQPAPEEPSISGPWIVTRKSSGKPQRVCDEQEQREWGGEANLRQYNNVLAARMLERQLGRKLDEVLAVLSKADPQAVVDLLRASLEASDRAEAIPPAVEDEPLLPLIPAPEQGDPKKPAPSKAAVTQSPRQDSRRKRLAKYTRPGRLLLDYGEMRHRCLAALAGGDTITAESVAMQMMRERSLDPNRHQRVRSDLNKRALRALHSLRKEGRVQNIGKGLGVKWVLILS